MGSDQWDKPSTQPAKTVLTGLLLFILALTVFLHFAYIIPPEEEMADRFFTILIAVTYENKNNGTIWDFTEDDRTVGLFMNTSWQMVYLMNTSYPIERFKVDSDGNSVALMIFNKSEIRPGESLTYEVAYRVILKPRSIPVISEENSGTLNDVQKDLKNLYCGSAGPWQVNDSKHVDLAYTVASNETKVLTIVKNFIKWIKSNITYGTLDVPRYPNETLQEGRGDCDDQANLLITLCRIVGIPSYLQIGAIYMPQKNESNPYWSGHLRTKLTKIGWHGWAMIFVPPWGWLPVDLTFSGNLIEDPLNAIKKAAIIKEPTVQYVNITRTDYVASSRNLRDSLIAHKFYIYESYAMIEETVKIITEGTNPFLQARLACPVTTFSHTLLSYANAENKRLLRQIYP